MRQALVISPPGALTDAIAEHLHAAEHAVTQAPATTVAATDAALGDTEVDAVVVVSWTASATSGETGSSSASEPEVIEAAATRLSASGGGSLVVVGSAAGLVGQPAGPVPAAAAALVGAVRRATAAHAAAGVAANLVAVGELGEEAVTGSGGPAPARARRGATARGTSLLGRPVTVDEVAAVVTFLCGPEAAFVNGAVVPVDGGASMGFL